MTPARTAPPSSFEEAVETVEFLVKVLKETFPEAKFKTDYISDLDTDGAMQHGIRFTAWNLKGAGGSR